MTDIPEGRWSLANKQFTSGLKQLICRLKNYLSFTHPCTFPSARIREKS